MRTRIAFLPLLATALLVGCGSLQRAGKDVVVVVTSPATIPLSAASDSLDWNEESSSLTSVAFFPVNFVLHAAKHVTYTVVHAADVVLCPLYLIASLDPDRDLEPLGMYSLTDGYPWKSYPVPAFEAGD